MFVGLSTAIILFMTIWSCKAYFISQVRKLTRRSISISYIINHQPFNHHDRNMGNYIIPTIQYVYSYLTQSRMRLHNSPKMISGKEKESSSEAPAAPYTMTTKKREDWNLSGLKEETSRQYLRAFKKSEKLHDRLNKIISKPENERSDEDRLTIQEINEEIESIQRRLSDVYALEGDLKKVRSVSDPTFPDIMERVIALEINDFPPPRIDHQKAKKPKAVPQGPRKPYNRYMSADNILIKVGRSAADNDDLSLNPQHREGSHWWMHVAGCPGSHVVICNSDDDFPTTYRQSLIDAALLAAVNSKAGQGGRVQVTYTRCRQVTKPYGAKPGLVFLKGDVATVRVDINAESARLERLTSTKDKEELYSDLT